MTTLQPGAPPKPRKAAKRQGHRDPVTPQLRAEVLARDRGCVAPLIDTGVDLCRGKWGERAWVLNEMYDGSVLTLDHVREEPMMGKRAPSDRAHLVTLCWHHHLDGWAGANRPALRSYLRYLSAVEGVA